VSFAKKKGRDGISAENRDGGDLRWKKDGENFSRNHRRTAPKKREVNRKSGGELLLFSTRRGKNVREDVIPNTFGRRGDSE